MALLWYKGGSWWFRVALGKDVDEAKHKSTTTTNTNTQFTIFVYLQYFIF